MEPTILVDLKAGVTQSREEGNEAGVCVLRYGYVVLLSSDLVILRDSSVARTVVVDRKGRESVSLIPLIEEVRRQLKAYSDVT